MKYIVDFDVFETAMLFAGVDDVRHFINGVHFIGGTVEATNGHIGYAARVETGEQVHNTDGCRVFPDVILRPLNKIPTKNKKNWFSYCAITIGEESRIDYIDFYGRILATDMVEIIEGRFPKLSKMISEHHKQDKIPERFGINTRYLAILDKALKREKWSHAVFCPKSSDKSILVSFKRPHLGHVKERALFMPVRLS